MIPSLTEDCASCAALCCLALAFDRGESFAIDKPAGTPCPNLSRHDCGIHDRLEAEGFAGCVRYTCTGAGQRVVQELFAGQSWQDDPGLLVPMMEAFRGMRAIQERLAQLSAARGLPLAEEDRDALDTFVERFAIGAIGQDMARDYPGSDLDHQIDRFIKSLSRYITR